MAYIPEFVKNSSLSAEVLTAIGEDIGVGVTVIPNDLDTLHAYGQKVLGNTVLMNQFISTLMNRIARVEYTSYAFANSLARLKKGILEFGETVEEIFVDLVRGVKENEDYANPSNPFNANMPDVKTAFHVSNLRCKYSVKIKRKDLRKAFMNFSGVDELIARLVESLYNQHNWDEYLLTKYKLAQAALANIKAQKDDNIVTDETTTEEEYAKAILKSARKYANIFPAYKTEYNEAGVHTHTPMDKLTCFMSADARATVDVEALASAFNLPYTDFIGQVITLDNFTFNEDEIGRICAITGLATEAFPITHEDMTLLEGTAVVLADDDLLQIYDTVEPIFSENYNGSDDVWNYYLHIDQVFSISPFMNRLVIGSHDPIGA